jgi:hypothetical protein
METRFDDLSPKLCLAVLIALVLAILLSLSQVGAPHYGPPTSRPPAGQITDRELYQRIADRVAAGESYYRAAVQEHRQHDYPLKPFVTVRLPTLAWINAYLGPASTQSLLLALVALVATSWLAALRPIAGDAATRAAVFVLIGCSTMLMNRPVPVIFHDTWAGVLIAASLGLRQRGRYAASIASGLGAVLFRELALPFLLMMAIFAAYENQRREAVGWCAAILVAGVCMGWHAVEVMSLRLPDDLSSPGWIGMGGWTFFISTVRATSAIGLMPKGTEYAAVPLCLFGWMSWKSSTGLRVSGFLLGYMVALAAFARTQNLYWALMIAPVLLGGLGLAPAAVLALFKRCSLLMVVRQPSPSAGVSR